MSETAPRPTAQARILIVEDEPQICALLGDIVEGEGLEPDCVQNDREAFAALRARPGYACMIVDVNLGFGATGYDVARFARTIQPQLPVIYVSGQTSEASYRANGVAGSLFLPKPFTVDQILHRIHKLIGDNDDEA